MTCISQVFTEEKENFYTKTSFFSTSGCREDRKMQNKEVLKREIMPQKILSLSGFKRNKVILKLPGQDR